MDYLALVVVLAVVAVVVFAVLGFQKMFGGISDWFGQFKLPEFTFPEITLPDFSGVSETFNYLFIEGGGAPSIIPSPPPSAQQMEYLRGGGEPIYVAPLWRGGRPYEVETGEPFDESTREIHYPIEVVVPSRPERIPRREPAKTVREYFRERGLVPRIR